MATLSTTTFQQLEYQESNMGVNIINGIERLTNPMYTHAFANSTFTPNGTPTQVPGTNTFVLQPGSYLVGFSGHFSCAGGRDYNQLTVHLYNVTAVGSLVSISTYEESATASRLRAGTSIPITITTASTIALYAETNGAGASTPVNNCVTSNFNAWAMPIGNITVI